MTNKERLESIKEDVEIGIKVWGISIDDINWLIKQVKLKIFSEEMLHPKLGVLNEFLQKRVFDKGVGNVGDNVIDVAIDLIETLEEENQALENTIKAHDHSKNLNAMVAGENVNLKIENQRYKQYLELIRSTGTHGKDVRTNEVLRSDEAELANEALEGVCDDG